MVTKKKGKTVSKTKKSSKVRLPPLPKNYRKKDRFKVLEQMNREELVFSAKQYGINTKGKTIDQLRTQLFRAMSKKIIIKKDKEISNVFAENRPDGSQIFVGDDVVGDHYDIIDYNPDPLAKVRVEDLGGTGVGIHSETPTGKKLQTIVLIRTDRELEDD